MYKLELLHGEKEKRKTRNENENEKPKARSEKRNWREGAVLHRHDWVEGMYIEYIQQVLTAHGGTVGTEDTIQYRYFDYVKR